MSQRKEPTPKEVTLKGIQRRLLFNMRNPENNTALPNNPGGLGRIITRLGDPKHDEYLQEVDNYEAGLERTKPFIGKAAHILLEKTKNDPEKILELFGALDNRDRISFISILNDILVSSSRLEILPSREDIIKQEKRIYFADRTELDRRKMLQGSAVATFWGGTIGALGLGFKGMHSIHEPDGNPTPYFVGSGVSMTAAIAAGMYDAYVATPKLLSEESRFKTLENNYSQDVRIKVDSKVDRMVGVLADGLFKLKEENEKSKQNKR